MSKPILKPHIFPDGDYCRYWWEGDDMWGQVMYRDPRARRLHGRPFKMKPDAMERKLARDRGER